MSFYPFVNFLMKPTSQVSSTPIMIFGNDQYTCLIDSILITNTSDIDINVSVTIAREEIIGTESYFNLSYNVMIPIGSRIDILQGQAFTLQAGDLMYAKCDYNSGLFDVFVVYRELLETSPTPQKTVR